MSTIVQPAPNTAAYPMNAWDLEAVKTWMKGAAGADALLRTQNAYQDYLNSPFASWAVNYQAGRTEDAPPAPPMGLVAQMSEDGLSWDLISSTTPSGPVPAYQKHSVVTTPFGSNPLAGMGGSRPLLVAPVGGRATQSDGTTWVRIS